MMNFKPRTLVIFLCLVFAACAAIAAVHIITDRNPPVISFVRPEPDVLNRESHLHIEVSSHERMLLGKNLDISAIQGGARHGLTPRERVFDAESGKIGMQIFPADSPGLHDGEILIEISAYNKSGDGFLDGIIPPRRTVHSFKIKADLSSPTADFVVSPPALTRGGAALIVITPGEELSAISLERDGHGCMLAPCGSGRYAALAAFPQDLPLEDFNLNLRLTDLAGNDSVMKLPVPGEDFQFRDDTIRLDDEFFRNKHQEFKNHIGLDASPIEIFLLMNRDVREVSYKELSALCANGSPAKLWQGAFLEMPGATRRSEFSDRRCYIHKGEIIDRQVHLGLDYASIAKDKIPVSNNGIVTFTGYLGIHGNAVLVDHGLGLFSLYSHLSGIEAEQGRRVEKGQIIGRTGSTGLAGGDHLHFEILVNGVSVNPDFFFNAEWLERNIDAPLAGLAETEK